MRRTRFIRRDIGEKYNDCTFSIKRISMYWKHLNTVMNAIDINKVYKKNITHNIILDVYSHFTMVSTYNRCYRERLKKI